MSSADTVWGTVAAANSEHGQLTETPRAVGVDWMLPLSSMARLIRLTDPLPVAANVYVQDVVPVARCQALPPSVEISTELTIPPTSEAVPVIVTWELFATAADAAGLVIDDVGAVVSADAAEATIPLIRVSGCAFMSAIRLITACCSAGSTVVAGPS